MKGDMGSTEPSLNRRNPLINVLTDMHFWIPVVVLIGGLLLLHLIR
jgi:hypothetical protein